MLLGTQPVLCLAGVASSVCSFYPGQLQCQGSGAHGTGPRKDSVLQGPAQCCRGLAVSSTEEAERLALLDFQMRSVSMQFWD